jgi:hypothetical protein
MDADGSFMLRPPRLGGKLRIQFLARGRPIVTLFGHIQNGVVVLDAGSPALPEGTRVSIVSSHSSLPAVPQEDAKPRLDFPLIRGGEPGTMHLTNAMIEAVFEEEDIEMLRRSGLDLPS